MVSAAAELAEAGRGVSMHILLVTIDSLRGDHLGCYGAQDIRTPHLDTLVGSGVRFH